ncbi:heavy-metal-associated domain-containing protein [Variovorax dokdonensis]|uniref:Heavy-metal-associated domain-containing protein n=1 Tax=Variovorax dokdonensis TaxID=344883 RepID=A0ABT7N768_9BURK|nr:heavy-metal-associated domain-containing protein [Variovorax dokdonensis]MDM0043757.1 heavy-metal-associated domain-containing protein [Variovorax dokdonensis]
MPSLRIDDMTCGHCASVIKNAVLGIDASAKIEVVLTERLVHVESTRADVHAISKAISGAGYSAVPVAVSEPIPSEAPGASRGCCGCGATASNG